MRRISLILALLTAVSAAPLALATPQNDAGSGGDAPNTSGGSPVITLGVGTVTGAVLYNEGDKEDWYAVSVPCGSFAISFRATSGGLWGGVYTSGGGFIQNAHSSGQTITLNPLAAGTYRFGLGDSSASTGSAAYTVTLTQRLPYNDAPAGCDAPDNSGAALDHGLGSYSGALSYGGGDKEDWYRFTVGACGLTVNVTATAGGFYAGIYKDDLSQMVAQAYVVGGGTLLTVYGEGAYRLGIGDQNGVGTASYQFVAAKMNDANSGCDASNTFNPAVNVGAGTSSGKLYYDLGDKEDWYHYGNGCQRAQVTTTVSNGGAWVGVYTDSGQLLDNAWRANGTTVTYDVIGTGWHLGIGDAAATSGRPDHSFTVTVVTTDPTGALCVPGTRLGPL